MADTCKICGHPGAERLLELYDDRYGYPGLFTLRRCPVCGHKQLDHRFSGENIGDLYSKYYPRSKLDLESYQPLAPVRGWRGWWSGAYRPHAAVPENVRVLDIGCGFGESLGYHQARGCEVFGVDADENLRRVAERFGFKAHVGIFDPNMFEANYFDFVTMDQVIEHVIDPLTTLRGIARVLKPGGTLIMATPNASGWGARILGRRWLHWHTPYHLHLYSTDSMRRVLEQAGLQYRKSFTRTDSNWPHFQWSHLVTLPAVGSPSAYWNPDKSAVSARQRRGLIFLTLLHRTGINHVLARIMDACAAGDNRFFFAGKPD